MRRIKVLVVEDQSSDMELVLGELRRSGYDPEWAQVQTEPDYLNHLSTASWDIILADFNMPQFDAPAALRLLNERGLDIPFIIVSGAIGEDAAVMAIRQGAHDYLLKDRLGRLGLAVSQALEQKRLRDERRRAESELRVAHEQLRHMLEHSAPIIYSRRLDGERAIPALISENVPRLLGFTVEDALSEKWWSEHLHPDDCAAAVASELVVRTEGKAVAEYRIRRKDGVYRWIEDQKQLVRDVSGQPVEIVGTLTDMTERKEAAEMMARISRQEMGRRNSRVSRTLSIIGGIGLVVFGLGYLLDLFLPPLKWLLRHSDTVVDEAAGTLVILCFVALFFSWRMLREIKNEANVHRQASETLQLLQINLDNRIKQRTAELTLVNESLRREVAERKQAEEKLLESEKKFRSLVEQSLVGTYIVQDDRFVYVNPKMSEILGYSEAEFAVMPSFDFVYEEDRPLVKANVENRLSGRIDNIRYTLRMVRKDAKVVDVEVHGCRADYNGRPAILGMLLDISDRRSLEKQLRQAQKMEAIGTLAGGIAHDFNNILGAINGYTELARMEIGDDAAVLENLDAVTQGGQRAAALVQQILTFSRKREQQRKPAHLRSVVEEALKLLRASTPRTIEFATAFSSDIPMVLADTTQIHQIVMNLGTNAWHAMRDKPGRLDVKLEAFDVDAEFSAANSGLRPGPYARLSIGDTGHGMDRAILERAFEPFFTTKAPGEGTGLGLAVVHGIMQSHDGAVTIYSQPGKGTVFHLYFPALASTESEVVEVVKEVARGNGQRILFVDDEEPLALLGQKILERLGYVVDTETSAPNALQTVRARLKDYAMVVTDQTMPGMTGTDLAKHLLVIRPDLPIILTTGFAANLNVSRIEELGIRELLLKPLTVRSLGEAVQRALTPSVTT